MKYQLFDWSTMPIAQSSSSSLPVTPRRVASTVAVLVGIALASYGGYTQYAVTRPFANGTCGGCTPWDPLFVVAPLLGGIALVAIGSYAFARTTC